MVYCILILSFSQDLTGTTFFGEGACNAHWRKHSATSGKACHKDHTRCHWGDLRLPVSSLLRFQRVCKQWCHIISDPRFVVEHAHRAPEHLLLFLPRVDISAGLKALKPGSAMIFDEKWSLATWTSMDPDYHLFASCTDLLCSWLACFASTGDTHWR